MGSRIRIVTTRTTDGETTVIEGRVEVIHEQIRPLAVELVNSHFAHIETVRQDATITWEEVEPPKPVLHEEPPNLAVVEFVYHQDWRDVAQRDDKSSDADGLSRWFVTGSSQVWTWAELCGRDMIAAITRLIPEPETFPSDLARRLAEQAAGLLIAAEEGKPPLPSTLHLARSVIAEVEFALTKEAD